MGLDIAGQIAQLRGFSRQQLLEIWQKLYRKAAPLGLRREIMVPFLAYKIQENAFGGLKLATRAELRRIARDLEESTSSTKMKARPRIKPGSRLLRRWRGEMHEVFVAELGYEYRGTRYRSLSEIARKITDTRWSGPAFFGLNSASPVRGRRNG
jgi:Protein of unknown function (DUF2924)